MTQESFINILIAEDNEISREMMAAVLRTHGYRVFGAINGESAIKVVEERPIDLALVDINMSPTGGFDFIKHLVVRGIKLPVVVVTADDSSHVLMESTALGVAKVIQKPVEPAKLLEIVERLLRRKGMNLAPLGVVSHETSLTPDALMTRAIEIADNNARSKFGGPFGAVVADARGNILGEGANGITSRVDPTAHAEVMAIRQAAEKLGRADLSDCVLYCSGEPTAMGKALIASVGIKTVYYGLSGDDVRLIRKSNAPNTTYTQMRRDDALKVFQHWQAQKDGVRD